MPVIAPLMSFKRRESFARKTNDEAISICFLVAVEKEIPPLMSLRGANPTKGRESDVAISICLFLNDKVEQGNKAINCHSRGKACPLEKGGESSGYQSGFLGLAENDSININLDSLVKQAMKE